jgi:hypothetical protein
VESEVHPLRFVLVSPVSKDGFAVKKILSFVALVGFITVLGCNDAKTTTSTTKPAGTTPPAGEKGK